MGTSMVIRTTAPQIPEQVQVGGKKKKCETASHIFGNRHYCVRNADAMRDKRKQKIWVGVQSFSELTSAEKSPFCRRMVLPPLAASIRVGIWARKAKASSMPMAVSTLLSITPIGGQTKPPTIRSIERCYFVNVILALTFMFFHNYALCEPYI